MDIVTRINNLISMAAALASDGAAVVPFRDGLFALKKAISKELKAFETRLSEMEADSKDAILAKENDRLSAALQEAQEQIERLEYTIAKGKKEKAQAKRPGKIGKKILLLLTNGRQLTRDEIMKETGLSADDAEIRLVDLKRDGMIWSRSPGGLDEGGKRQLMKRAHS